MADILLFLLLLLLYFDDIKIAIKYTEYISKSLKKFNLSVPLLFLLLIENGKKEE
jgi:hypothetical protein